MQVRNLIKLILFVLIQISGSALYADVIFEHNFDGFTSEWVTSGTGGHAITGGTPENPGRNVPDGWTGYIDHHPDNYIGIIPGEGLNSTPCLKIGPDVNKVWSQVGIVKYLGEDGYDELYIRYYIKFDQNWRWGNGQNGSVVYYKWLRIWQNVPASEILGDTGSLGDEHARGAMVVGTYENDYSDFSPYFQFGGLNDATGDTNAGDFGVLNYYPWDPNSNGGYIENNFGNIDDQGFFDETQVFHCVEFHIKLASAFGEPDGIFEMWVDGIKQKAPTYKSRCDGMQTGKLGTGMNYLTFHDNGTGAGYWDDIRYVWIDDVVVSTDYVGPDYIVGGPARGDINGDRMINILDVTKCVSAISQSAEADINGDNQTNEADVEALVNIIIGI